MCVHKGSVKWQLSYLSYKPFKINHTSFFEYFVQVQKNIHIALFRIRVIVLDIVGKELRNSKVALKVRLDTVVFPLRVIRTELVSRCAPVPLSSVLLIFRHC